VSEKYEFIDAQYAEPPAAGGNAPTITCMCKWLGVSKSGFYEWRSRPESATVKRRAELKLLITKAFDDSDGTYGYRRIWSQLARWGVHAGLELVRALMRELGINETSLGNWVRAYREKHAGDEPPLQLSERARLRELERENRELRMKAEFLSKAAAYYAAEHRGA